MPASKNPLAGTRPSGDERMQIVPPVMMIRTRVSGYVVAILGTLRLTILESRFQKP
jgi:hypothetical protein